MTNDTLKAVFAKYGHRVAAIGFDNGRQLFIGYKGHSASLRSYEDIIYETIGDEDFIAFNLPVPNQNKFNGKEITVTDLHPTSQIQFFKLMGEGLDDCRIDPYLI